MSLFICSLTSDTSFSSYLGVWEKPNVLDLIQTKQARDAIRSFLFLTRPIGQSHLVRSTMDGWGSFFWSQLQLQLPNGSLRGRKEAPNVVHGCTTFSSASSALCNDMWRLIHKKQVDVPDETNKHLSRAQELGWVCVSLSLLILSYPVPWYAILCSQHILPYMLVKAGARISHSRQTNILLFFCFFFFGRGVTTDQGLLCSYLVSTWLFN